VLSSYCPGSNNATSYFLFKERVVYEMMFHSDNTDCPRSIYLCSNNNLTTAVYFVVYFLIFCAFLFVPSRVVNLGTLVRVPLGIGIGARRLAHPMDPVSGNFVELHHRLRLRKPGPITSTPPDTDPRLHRSAQFLAAPSIITFSSFLLVFPTSIVFVLCDLLIV